MPLSAMAVFPTAPITSPVSTAWPASTLVDSDRLQ